MSGLKVWMLTPLFFPVKGGTEVHVYNLSKQLVRQSVEVQVHTTRDTYTQRGALSESEIIDGIRIVRHSRTWSFGDSPSVLHFHKLGRRRSLWNLYTIYFLLLDLRSRGVPTLMTSHASLVISRGALDYLQRAMARRLSALIAVSEWEREQMIKRGFPATKIRVVPNGVEEEAFTLPPRRIQTDRPFLLFLARFSRNKRQDMAIRALRKVSGVDLVLAGQVHDVGYFNELKALVKSLGLEDRVKFMLDVDQATKYALLDSCTALILTSEVEGEPLVVKEAMARGKPVIARNKTVFPYLIGKENGFLVSDEDELANAIDTLLSSQELAKRIGEANLAKAKQWRWEIIAKRILEIYREVGA